MRATEGQRTWRRECLSVAFGGGRKGRLWRGKRGTQNPLPLHPCRRRRAAAGTVRWPACESARGPGGARAEFLAGGDPTAASNDGGGLPARGGGSHLCGAWRGTQHGSTRRSCEETWARAGRRAALFLFVFSLFARHTASLALRCVLETRRPAAAFLARPKGPARLLLLPTAHFDTEPGFSRFGSQPAAASASACRHCASASPRPHAFTPSHTLSPHTATHCALLATVPEKDDPFPTPFSARTRPPILRQCEPRCVRVCVRPAHAALLAIQPALNAVAEY